MAIVNVEKNSYKVEPLYQWDLNQELQIAGLSLATVPEIHFTNVAMSRAIVRQARMDTVGVVTVDIPNSLLQKPYTIQVYVCTYAGSTFETQYKLELPVKARTQPADYVLEGDQEVYSFNALENRVVNALARCDSIDEKYEAAVATQKAAAAAYAGAKGEVESAIGAAVDTALASIPTLTEDEVQAICEDGQSAGLGKFLTEPGLLEFWAQIKEQGVKIATGTYKGTGTNGSSNPNSVQIDFTPSLVVVSGIGEYPSYSYMGLLHIPSGLGFSLDKKDYPHELTVSCTDGTVEWYYSTTDGQLNQSGVTYHYFAIG